NGFGRIGKRIFTILRNSGFEVPLVNDPFIDEKYMEYLMKYDSVYGRTDAYLEGNSLLYRGAKTFLSQCKDQAEIPWGSHGIDLVVESSGVFLTKEACEKHNAKNVILTAPSKGIPMFVYGVNHESIRDEKVISAASCTTNCLAPLAKILSDAFGIEEGFITTVHAVTPTQRISDAKGSKWRSSRSGLANIIPASTGAAQAVGKVLPELQGKMDGMAFRVPIQTVSVVDLVVRLSNPATLEEIAKCIEKTKYNDVIGITREEVVSSDFIADPRSSILDMGASMAMGDRFFKLISWYDNEHGYSQRVVDLIRFISK
ncbi:hypothetical protein ENBRE01_2521, partial [Enteropsectra breve]